MPLLISNNPHLRAKPDTPYLMRQVIIALLPAAVASVIFFRHHALFLIANCVVSSVAAEALIVMVRKKSVRALRDGSAVVSGLLLAFILPPSTAWYAASLGAFFAIIVVKHLFGGLGANIFNPALAGRAFLMAAYPTILTRYSEPGNVDAVSRATPLALNKFSHVTTPLAHLFWGTVSGSLGETSAVCLLVGGIYLLSRGVIEWRIPASVLAAVAIVSALFYKINPAHGSMLFHLLSGGLLLGAFFMATDPVTTPVTSKGRIIFGASCGLLIMIIRYFGGMPEGVMYSILFMNACTPLLNRYTRPKRFGT
ncbi:MAG: RnfABCDGE type electron transport complex subunit D [Candidatus Omnitrophota bacterium]